MRDTIHPKRRPAIAIVSGKFTGHRHGNVAHRLPGGPDPDTVPASSLSPMSCSSPSLRVVSALFFLASALPLVPGIAAAADGSNPAFGEQRSATGIRHSFLFCGSHTVLAGEDGLVAWQSPGASRDGFVLANGNVLVSQNNRARELTREGAEIWSYPLSPENKELGTVARLDNGNTLVVERGEKPRLIEVAPDGSVAVQVPLQPETGNAHMQTRQARKLANGNYLVPHLLAFAVKEYAPDGAIVKVFRTDLEALGGRKAEVWPFTAIRLPGGNTLVTLTHGNRVVEFDPEGQIAWSLDNVQAGGRLADPCGAQRLANGNTVICCYGQKDPAKPRMVEVTRDGAVVWEFFHPAAKAHGVHVLTTNGTPEGALK